jgi:hypothetical protein
MIKRERKREKEREKEKESVRNKKQANGSMAYQLWMQTSCLKTMFLCISLAYSSKTALNIHCMLMGGCFSWSILG